MSLLETIRQDLNRVLIAQAATASIKEREIPVYRSIIAQCQTDYVREAEPTNEQVIASIRKLYNENKTAIAKMLKEATDRQIAVPQHIVDQLELDNIILAKYLPAILDQPYKIQELLQENKETIKAIVNAKNDGMAVGIAMKFFKANNITVDGNVVKTQVLEIRSADAK
jgi:hypothetical protein